MKRIKEPKELKVGDKVLFHNIAYNRKWFGPVTKKAGEELLIEDRRLFQGGGFGDFGEFTGMYYSERRLKAYMDSKHMKIYKLTDEEAKEYEDRLLVNDI